MRMGVEMYRGMSLLLRTGFEKCVISDGQHACFARLVDVFHGKYAYCVVVFVCAAGPDVQARQYIGLMY